MKTNNINNMSTTELSNWFALIKSLSIIHNNCTKNKKNFNKINLNSIHIKKYIDDVSPSISKMLEEDKLRNINNSLTLQFLNERD